MRPVYTLTLVGVAAVVAAGTICAPRHTLLSIPEVRRSWRRLSCADCSPPASQANSKEPMPAPTETGIAVPSSVRGAGQRGVRVCGKLWATWKPKLEERAGHARIDAEEFPQAGTEWRLHIVPTHVLVSPEGEELWRHEGAVTEDEASRGSVGAVDASGSVELS